jgi:hypothetical protein
VLIAAGRSHDEVQKLLEFLYRHLMKRREDPPAGFTGYVYSDEVQYKTPPRSPIAQITMKPGAVGPEFENKVPLEFWQQIEQALLLANPGWKKEKKVERDDPKKTLVLTQRFTEAGEERYVDKLSYNQAVNTFADTTKALFEGVPELAAMTFVGLWKDKEVMRAALTRADYDALKLSDLEEQVGQVHGRTFLELSLNKTTDEKAAKANTERIQGLYKKALGPMVKAGKITISQTLK